VDEPVSWSDMYRAHTCFKGLCSFSKQLQPGDLVRMESHEGPPCRACRAWWAQACHRLRAGADFSWPGGRWRVPGDSRPRLSSHNRFVTETYVVDGVRVIAEENQRCALWGVPVVSVQAVDPEVYQSDLLDETYGPWRPLSMTVSAFEIAFRMWNEANGGAPVSAFGVRSETTVGALSKLSLDLRTPHYLVYKCGDTLVCAAGDEDIYVWGIDEQRVRAIVLALDLAWDDLET
jgi:hypothetical protein